MPPKIVLLKPLQGYRQGAREMSGEMTQFKVRSRSYFCQQHANVCHCGPFVSKRCLCREPRRSAAKTRKPREPENYRRQNSLGNIRRRRRLAREPSDRGAWAIRPVPTWRWSDVPRLVQGHAREDPPRKQGSPGSRKMTGGKTVWEIFAEDDD
jgi:hypothetical protein